MEKNEHEHEHEHDDEIEVDDEAIQELIEDGLEQRSQIEIFLEMREQNVELLKLAAEVAGFTGPHPAVKPGDVKTALRTIWDVYSEFYSWIDPEEAGDDDEDDEDDEL